MSETETYYRSVHPALSEWKAEHERRHAAYSAAVAALEAEHPGCEAVVQDHRLVGKRTVIGLNGDNSPGPLWRKKDGEWWWTPTLRSKAGKELAARLKSIYLQRPPVPGMPDLVSAESHFRSHGFEIFREAFYVSWACEAQYVEADAAFDATLWERIPASTYHLAKEMAAAAKGDEDGS